MPVLAQLHPLARRHGRARVHAGHRSAVRRASICCAPSPRPVRQQDGAEDAPRPAILYAIYCAMTLLQILFYRLGVLFGWGEITWFDSLCLAFGTAGTGGFSVQQRPCGLLGLPAGRDDGVHGPVRREFLGVFLPAAPPLQARVAQQRMRWYFIIIFGAIVLITANLLLTGGFFSTVFQTIHHVAFSVGSVITTTGFGTADFAKWPEFSKTAAHPDGHRRVRRVDRRRHEGQPRAHSGQDGPRRDAPPAAPTPWRS